MKPHEISKSEFENKVLSYNPNFISIRMAGDKEINVQNIQLFDKTVTDNTLKSISLGTPSSSPNEGRPKVFEKDRGIFWQSRYYFFKMKLKNEEVAFKTYLFYNSDIYFDELNSPKTDQDTLLYYSNSRFYQFYKKK